MSFFCCGSDTDNVCGSSDGSGASSDIRSHCKTPRKDVISIPGVVAARLVITGIIVAANGMLSMKALATAETMTIIAIIRAIFPPLTFSMIPARIFRTPVCSRPPTTTKRPIKKRSV